MSDSFRNPAPTNPSADFHGLVSIIVVNYNGGEKVLKCLESLETTSYSQRELIVIDNASTDESRSTLEVLASQRRDLKLILSPENLGYAGGVNLAMGAANGEYLAILNMDIDVDPGWLEPLIDFLERHPDVAAVNPLITLADGKRINAMGQHLHVTGLGFNRLLGHDVEAAPREPVEVLGIQGGAFVVRHSLLKRMGGMDASGFLYHEDVNLSWLLRLMGHRLFCVPKAIVRHDYFLSMYPAKLHLLERNRWAMLLAYLRTSTLLLLSPALLATEALMWAYCVWRGPSFMKAKLTAYRWVWRHRTQIRRRQVLADSLRVLTDWNILEKLNWRYDSRQLAVLGMQRGPSRREPKGGLPLIDH